MRIKRIAALTALFMLMAVFVCSLTVFAVPVEDETTAPAAPAAPAAQTPQTQTPAPAAEPTVAPAAPEPTLSPNALTPDGQASVLNYYQSDSDDKEFYTITTPAGNVFYLVIDGARGSENVYFLNAVTESDLMALAAENDRITISSIPSSSQTCTCTDKCENGKVNADCPVCKNDTSKCAGGSGAVQPSTNDEAPGSGGGSDKGDNNMMMYIIIGAAFVLVAGVGIYAKIIKPKKQGASFDDDDDSEEEYAYSGGDYEDEHYGSPEYLPEDDSDGVE